MRTATAPFGWCSLVSAALLFTSVPARAQIPNCGGTSNQTTIFQAGPGVPYVHAIFSTTRNHDGCFYKVRTEGWVDGVGGAGSAEGAYEAILRLGEPVPDFSPRGATGKHFMILLLPPWTWSLRGITHAETDLTPPPPPDDDENDDGDGEGSEEGEELEDSFDSPVVLDPDFDGFHLTGPEVLFDIDGDGERDLVSWTEVRDDGSVDAWLACDWNGNGTIDDGAELFGNHTRAYADRPDVPAADGFKALGFMQGPTFGASVPDDAIDARDAIWPRLLLWRDVNHNGISEPNELQPVHESALAAISLDARTIGRKDRYGNEFRQRAESRWERDGKTVKSFVFDVWLTVGGR